jgi:hypothetical protein
MATSLFGQDSFYHNSLWFDGFVVTTSGIDTMTNISGLLAITNNLQNTVSISLRPNTSLGGTRQDITATPGGLQAGTLFIGQTSPVSSANGFTATGSSVITASNLVVSNATFVSGNPLFSTIGISNGNAFYQGASGAFGGTASVGVALTHGGPGDGTEYEINVNRYAVAVASGSDIQNGSGAATTQDSFINLDTVPGSHMGQSGSWAWHIGFNPSTNTGLLWIQKWDAMATNYDNTNGNSSMDFWATKTNQAWGSGQDMSVSTKLFSIDSQYGIIPRIGQMNPVLSSSPGSNCVIDFHNAPRWGVISLVTATTFSLTNVDFISMEKPIDLWIYPGLSQKQVTFPTNLQPESESGLSVLPTNVPANNILHVQINAVYGAITNISLHAWLIPYVPILDPTASGFINTFSITAPSEKDAINNLVIELKNGNIFTLYDVLDVYCGSSSNSCKGNLANTNLNGIFNGAPSAFTFDSLGASGDGSTSFMDTQFKPSTAPSPNFTLNSAGTIYYSRFNAGFNGSTGNAVMGWGANAGNNLCSSWTTAGTATVATAESFRGPNDLSSSTITYGNGFHIMNRTSSTAITYVSGNTSQTISSAAVAVNAQNGYVFANDDGGASRFSTNRVGILGIRGGFNATQLNTESNAFTHFLQALNRL